MRAGQVNHMHIISYCSLIRRVIIISKHFNKCLLTHHCVRYMVVERYQELLHAFDAQTSADDGSDEIDTRKLMAGMAPAY